MSEPPSLSSPPRPFPASPLAFGSVASRFARRDAAEPLPGQLGLAIRAAEELTARAAGQTAECLSKSCLYFTPENIAALGGPPDPLPLVERIDQETRALVLHIEMTPAHEARLRRLSLALGDLRAAGAASARAAHQLSLLQRTCLPASAKALLRRPTDAVIRLTLATASAIERDCEHTARTTLREFPAFETLHQEVYELLRGQSAYMPRVIGRMMRATLIAVGVAGDETARVAAAFSLPPARAVDHLSGAAAARWANLAALAASLDLAPLPE